MSISRTRVNRIARIRPIRRLLAIGIVAAGVSSTAVGETVVVYGATGNIGAKIVTEALDRGHEVIGVSRDRSWPKSSARRPSAGASPSVTETIL